MGALIDLSDRFNLSQSKSDTDISGKEWPPLSERERLKAYADNRDLFDGEHQNVLSGKHNATHEYEYISVNVPKNIVTVVADLLFGEDLALVYDDDVDDGAKEKVDDIWSRNQMQALLFEGALDTGYSGDGIWTVGREADGESGLAKIKTHPADTWFPEQNPDDVRDILRHRLAWVKKYKTEGGKEQDYLRVVVHEKGRVLHELYRLVKGKIDGPASPQEWGLFYDTPPDQEQEGIPDEFLLEHVPNFRTAREYKGTSEYKGCEDLFATLNGTVTQIDGILQRHSDPQIAMPVEMWHDQTDGGRKQPDIARLRAFAIDQAGTKPEYITWDGKLTDNLAFMDTTMQQIALVSETAPQLLSRGEWGGDLSGRALKILLIRTLAKVRRKRRYYDAMIPRLLEKAQLMEGVTEPIKVRLDWPDGLPDDILERVEVVDRRLANGTESQKGAIKTLDGGTDEQAEAKINEIDEDGGREDAQMERTVQGRQAPTIPVNVNLGDVE
ncbi:MAG: phage portal protein [bacterium]|nr:phage portal protein [bacterium]